MPEAKKEYEVENLFIDRLKTLGYEYVEMHNYSDVLKNFREKLCALNSDVLKTIKGTDNLSDSEFERVMIRLDGHTIYESAKILREKWVLLLDNGKTVYIKFLTNNPHKNIFQVTHQVTMDKEHLEDVSYKNRYDVTILINGLPLVQVELKRPGVEINEAVNQINRYRKFSFKGLFRYIQIFVVSNSAQTKYFANENERDEEGNVQNILKSLVFYWTDDKNERINRLEQFTDDFFRKFALTELLTKYFVVKDTEPVLMVMRPYQIYAVKKSHDRIIMADMNGYVWHTTGSGKTLTSFKLATILRDDVNIDRVFFLIDRKDLDDQTVEEYNSYEKDCVDNTPDTKTLIKDLQLPDKKLIITTIQKMATALRPNKDGVLKYATVMDPFQEKKCVFIIDECHRSQFGKMHGLIEKHFHNANYIGFTGTPIFKENKGANKQTTADVFKPGGNADPCIHKYLIKEAIADGNVLRFSVEYMQKLTAVMESGLKKKGIDSEKLDDPEYCKRHNIDLDNFYHSDARMEAIADNILKDLPRHTHPEGTDVYTAIFATDKISSLVKYYKLLKKKNTKGYKIAAIFTFQQNEDPDDEDAGTDKYAREELEECISDYNGMFGTEFSVDSFNAYRKDVAKRMKQKKLPQIDLLLVVDMMLTGFDSKPTNTLILDKNLVWHSLLQAYSRTNRVDKKTKQFGQIVTYRNIKKAQDDALKLFSGSGNPAEFLMKTYEYYLTEYRKNVEKVRAIAETPDDAGDLQDEDSKRDFVLAFRSVVGNLATLKTFSKFQWEDLAVFLDEDEYADYKSWYLTFKEEGEKHPEKHPELIDIDFDIELVRTDKINVVYIINLLKSVNKKDPEKRKQDIDLIIREIERSDNENLRHKKDMLKEFITERFFALPDTADVNEAFDEYESECMERDMEEFSAKEGLEKEIVSDLVHRYFMDENAITKEEVRQKYSVLHMGLLKLTSLIDTTMDFLKAMYDKYTAEGV